MKYIPRMFLFLKEVDYRMCTVKFSVATWYYQTHWPPILSNKKIVSKIETDHSVPLRERGRPWF